MASYLIILATGAYVLGFLFRDELHTRVTIVIGSTMYIIYYAVVGPVPLWDAIIGSSLIVLASFQGIVRLYWSKLIWAVPKDALPIFENIGRIEPGLFRQLYRAADQITVTDALVLTQEHKPVGHLWYLVEGELSIDRAGQTPASVKKPGFVGEIAWLTKSTASATVKAQPGAILLHWPAESLKRATRKSNRLELALGSLVAQDLARKLSTSHPVAPSPPPTSLPHAQALAAAPDAK